MKYFVSGDDSAYCQWQLDLLLASMKDHDLADRLVVAMHTTEQPNKYEHARLIPKHQPTLMFDNIGNSRGFPALNELYRLAWVLRYMKIQDPLCILKPHAVISASEVARIKDIDHSAVFVGLDPNFTFAHAEKHVPEFWRVQGKDKEHYQKNWIPFGKFFILNRIPADFLDLVIRTAELFVVQQVLADMTPWAETTRLAWALCIADHTDKMAVDGSYDMVAPMASDKPAPIIDYEHGFPPIFNKEMFSFPPPLYMSFGDPIEKIAECFNTRNSHFMSQLAEKILAWRKK